MFRGIFRCIVGMPYVKAIFKALVHKKNCIPRMGISREVPKITHRTGLRNMKVESKYQNDNDFSTLSHDFLKIHQNSKGIGR